MIKKKVKNRILGKPILKTNPNRANIDMCSILSIPENINQYSLFSTPGLRSIYVSIAQ